MSQTLGRVLVADDEPNLREALRIHLERSQFEVLVAEDGQAALELALKEQPDVIVLDVMMPRLDGYETCRQLRAHYRTRHIPILMLTAKTLEDDKVTGLEGGANDYLTKPWTSKELIQRIKNHLEWSRTQRSVSPLTGLPGNFSIMAERERRIGSGQPFAQMTLDLDSFKAFNDRYGFARGDVAITAMAETLVEVLQAQGLADDFVGHIGGDDFVIITVPDRSQAIAEAVKTEFDARVPEQYDPADREARRITVLSSRQGGWRDFDILSITILIVTNVGVEIQHSAQVSDTAKDLKKRGKAIQGSVIVYDRRAEPTTPPVAVVPKPAAPNPPVPPRPPSEGPRGAGEP